MRDLDLIVIHCSATREGVDVPVSTIRKWHKQRGFSDIGYHFVIHLDGRVEKGRPIEKPGAHAKGYNSNSIGVCYIGGTDEEGRPKDTRTTAQIHALRVIVDVLHCVYNIADTLGHRDLSVDLNGDGVISKDEWIKQCPCFCVATEL